MIEDDDLDRLNPDGPEQPRPPETRIKDVSLEARVGFLAMAGALVAIFVMAAYQSRPWFAGAAGVGVVGLFLLSLAHYDLQVRCNHYLWAIRSSFSLDEGESKEE